MKKFLDAVRLALSSIWANKLRSFMMVLGNIVAVTSIIAVVSLIQGMNGYVSDAILTDVGVGTFQVERQGPTTSEEEEERQRNNPRITLVELDTLAKAGDDHRRRDGPGQQRRAGRLPRRTARQRADPRRLGGVPRVRRLRPGARPAAQPHRDRARRARSRYPRLGHRRSALQGRQPDRPEHPGQAACTSA